MNKQLQAQRHLWLEEPAAAGPAAWRNRCLRSVLLPAASTGTAAAAQPAQPTASARPSSAPSTLDDPNWRAWLPKAAVAHAFAMGLKLPEVATPCSSRSRLAYTEVAELVTLRRLQHQLRVSLLHLYLTERPGSALLQALDLADGDGSPSSDGEQAEATERLVAHCRLVHALLCCGAAVGSKPGATGLRTRASRLVIAEEQH